MINQPKELSSFVRHTLTDNKSKLEELLPTLNYESYMNSLRSYMDAFLKNMKEKRTFTMQTTFDTDSVATAILLNKLYPDKSTNMVFMRIGNEIDKQRQGRKDRFIKKYGSDIVDINSLIEQKDPYSNLKLIEFHLDDTLKGINDSLGWDPEYQKKQKLVESNYLNGVFLTYLTIVANLTRGVPIGTLNRSAFDGGDFYRHIVIGDVFPLGTLYRTDVNGLLKWFEVPEYLRSVSPWKQRIRSPPDTPFWNAMESQNGNDEIKLLPRNFYRFFDPVSYLMGSGYDRNKVIDTLKEKLHIKSQDVSILEQMVDVVLFLKKIGEAKKRSLRKKVIPKQEVERR